MNMASLLTLMLCFAASENRINSPYFTMSHAMNGLLPRVLGFTEYDYTCSRFKQGQCVLFGELPPSLYSVPHSTWIMTSFTS